MKTDAGQIAVVPTWDALFADPSMFEALPPAVKDALYEEVAVLEARLRARLLARRVSMTSAADAERLVLIDEAAKMLSTSEDTLYSKWRKLPFAFKDPLDGKIKFRATGIEKYIAARAH